MARGPVHFSTLVFIPELSILYKKIVWFIGCQYPAQH